MRNGDNTRRICVLAWMAALLAMAWPAGAAESAARAGRYKALVVAVRAPKAVELKDLAHVDTSAARLVKALQEVGYVADVFTCASQGEQRPTAENILRWLKQNADPSRADLVILHLVGHGILRDGEEVFMTMDATMNEGGLRLGELDALCAAGNWRLVVVMDACRRGEPERRIAPPATTQPEPTAGEVAMGKAARAKERGLPVSAETRPARGVDVKDASRIALGKGCTRMFSTRYEKSAVEADYDLTSALAEGLGVLGDAKRFRADPWVAGPSRGGQDGANPLTLLAWFHYGDAKMTWRYRYEYVPVFEIGSVPLEEPIAQANPPGLPGRGFVVETSDLDLMRYWWPSSGDYQGTPCQDGLWLITPVVNTENARGEPWESGYVHDRGNGHDTTGKALFVEIYAIEPGTEKVPPTVTFSIDAKHVDDNDGITFITDNAQSAQFVAPWDRPTWCKVRLKPGCKLNDVAIARIEPSGASVYLRRMYLAEETKQVPANADRNVDLLARWLVRDDRGGPDTSLVRGEWVDGRYCLRIGKNTTGWIGGMLGPAVWLNYGGMVRLEMKAVGNAEVGVTVQVKQDRQYLFAKRIMVKGGAFATYSIDVTRNDRANYLALHNPTGEVLIRAIWLEPK